MRCPSCGSENEYGSTFCVFCGGKIPSGGGSMTPPPPPMPVPPVPPVGGGRSVPPMPGGGTDYYVDQTKTDRIRKYFEDAKIKIWPFVMAIIGFIMLVMGITNDATGLAIIGMLLTLIGGAVVAVTFMNRADDARIVDEATREAIEYLKIRGKKKGNVINEEIGLVDPIVLSGFGDSPDSSFDDARRLASEGTGVLSVATGKLAKLKNKIPGSERDPYEAYKIGKDEVLRSMLIQTTVFMFTKDQLLRYCGNIDVSTGFVYRESIDEVFYSDIEGMKFSTNMFKVYNSRTKKMTNKKREVMSLFMAGTTFFSGMNMEADSSRLDKEFNAMRSLIRDKKNN